MQLRDYQQGAVDAVYDHLRNRDDNPCVVIPTGGGKTPIMATICMEAVQKWGGRVLVLAHRKELLEQTATTLGRVADGLDVGIYSAGLNRRDKTQGVIVAGIQSVCNRACELGRFDLVIVDECFVEGTPISTPTGNRLIEKIQPGDYVHNANGVGRVLAVSASLSNQLVTLEFTDGKSITCTVNHPVFTQNGWRPAGAMELGEVVYGFQEMSMLRECVHSMDKDPEGWKASSSKGKAIREANVLLNLLLEDPQELHEGCINSKEGEQQAERDWAQTGSAGRKWGTDEAAEDGLGNIGRGLGFRTCGTNCERFEFATFLKNRHCESNQKDCHRSRRAQSSRGNQANGGFEEDAFSGAKRLAGITHHKSTNAQPVFNLQVEGSPTYFANDILVHNCQLIPPAGDGMYQTFLRDAKAVNPHIRLIGLTATPYRLKTGWLCGAENILNEVCYEAGVKELISRGFLSPMATKAGKVKPSFDGLHTRAGEFISSEVDELMDTDELVGSAVAEIVELTKDRKSVLLFCTGIDHARHVATELSKHCGALQVATIFGETPSHERADIIDEFKRGDIKFLCNVDVLTVGFDAPGVDCVCLLRPTLSPGLYYQMVGRGFRIADDKADCLVLDYGGNILRHGPVDAIQVKTSKGDGNPPAKECPECQWVGGISYERCPDCGYEFPKNSEALGEKAPHDREASEAAIVSEITVDEYEVRDVIYNVHEKRGAKVGDPRTMRVRYRLGFHLWVSEWVCFEHQGYALGKARKWWAERSNDPFPDDSEHAVALAEAGALAPAERVTIKTDSAKDFPEIVSVDLGEKPDAVNLSAFPEIDENDIPF